MARGVNKVILVGNLGADPDVRYSPAGSAVTKFSVATSESWKDKQTEQQQERTEWHNVVCFARLGEIAGQYLHKGSKVYIEGSLRTSSWEAQDGQKRYRTEVVAREMQMLDSRGDSAGASAPPAGADMNQQQSYAQERGSSPPEQPAAESAQPVAQPQPSAAETELPVEDDIPF